MNRLQLQCFGDKTIVEFCVLTIRDITAGIFFLLN